MDNLDIFENACKYFLEKMTEFKEILSSKVDSLNNKDWILSKGSTKTCKADETGKKKRCKVGLNYGLKIELSVADVQIIWNEFSSFFTKAYVENIERISNNEEIGRYEFIARSSIYRYFLSDVLFYLRTGCILENMFILKILSSLLNCHFWRNG